MKDYLGFDCDVGDVVVFNEPNFHNLVRGEIIKLTPKGIRATYHHDDESMEKKDTFILEKQFVKIQ